MSNLKFTYGLSLTCAWLVYLTCNLYLVESVEIECIPLQSCPTVLKLIAINKNAPETDEFLKNSHCGFDGKGQPKVWCSQLNFCKTPDNINGTCTPIKKCKSFLQLKASLDTSDMLAANYLNQFRCNTILKNLHVCCPHEIYTTPDYPDYEESNILETEPNYFVSTGTPDIGDRFADSDYESENTYGWVGDQPEFYHHQDPHIDMFHRNMHPPSTRSVHKSWNSDQNTHENGWGMPTHSHGHGFDYGHERWNMHGNVGDPVHPEFSHNAHRGFPNPLGFGSNHIPTNTGRVTPHHGPHHNRGNTQSDFNNKHGTTTESHVNRGATEESSWDSAEYTTARRKSWKTTEQTTTRNEEHGTERGSKFNDATQRSWKPQKQTTPSSRDISTTPEDPTTWGGSKPEGQTTTSYRSRGTTKKYNFKDTTGRRPQQQTTPANEDEGRIIFEDSFETSSETNTQASDNRRRSGQNSTGDCETPDKKEGICTKQSNCQSYLKLQQNLDKSKKNIREYLSKFKCNSSNRRESYVCCQKDEDKDIDNSVFNAERTNEGVPEPYSKICGRRPDNNNRIFGGTTTGLGEFPWIALLQYPGSKGLMSGCGGTLINSRYILTAAHCVDEEILRKRRLQSLRQVILGEYDTRNETDCIYTEYGTDCAEPPKKYGVESIVRHKLYSSDTTRHDIALVRLDQEVTFTDYIKPICLPTNTSTLNGNETFIISGWGRTPTEMSSPILKKTKIPFVQKEKCNIWNTKNRSLIDGQICAGRGNGTDSCSGDSGGPVMLEVNFNFELVTHLVGIISYGFGECGNGPSVNTYVPYYIDWINENMKL